MNYLSFASNLIIGDANVKEVPCLVGQGAPTIESVPAVIGCFYMDKDTGTVYKCIKDGSENKWSVLNEGSSGGDALAAPKQTQSYETVPVIKRNTYGTKPEDFNYSIVTQGAAQDTIALRAQGGAIRANCSEAIGNEIASHNGEGGEVAKNQMLVNYGFLKSQLSIVIPFRLPNSGDKLIIKPGHKYYISSGGCKLTNGSGSTYGSFTKAIGDGLIACSSAGYNDGSGTHNGSTSFRAFIISVSGLSSSSGNMEIGSNACYIENTSGEVAWVYDEGPAEDFN